jgi:hypothetical protein
MTNGAQHRFAKRVKASIIQTEMLLSPKSSFLSKT